MPAPTKPYYTVLVASTAGVTVHGHWSKREIAEAWAEKVNTAPWASARKASVHLVRPATLSAVVRRHVEGA